MAAWSSPSARRVPDAGAHPPSGSTITQSARRPDRVTTHRCRGPWPALIHSPHPWQMDNRRASSSMPRCDACIHLPPIGGRVGCAGVARMHVECIESYAPGTTSHRARMLRITRPLRLACHLHPRDRTGSPGRSRFASRATGHVIRRPSGSRLSLPRPGRRCRTCRP